METSFIAFPIWNKKLASSEFQLPIKKAPLLETCYKFCYSHYLPATGAHPLVFKRNQKFRADILRGWI